MATYNGEKYINAQFESILSQLGPGDEVIVSDDNSSDKTIENIRKLQDPRIRIFMNEVTNRGYTRNFENALRHSKGDYIFLCDQDDVWHENKVTVTMAALQLCDFSVSDARVVDENLSPIIVSHFMHSGVQKGFAENFLKTRYIGACMAFRRKVLDVALPFPANSQLCAHDYWIAIVAECYFNVQLIQEPLVDYRRHQSNASSGGLTKSQFSPLHRLIKRIYCALLLIYIYPRTRK